LVVVPVALSAGLLGVSAPSGAAGAGAPDVGAPALAGARTADGPLALWKMNEGRGATVMADSSGHGIKGHIGSAVQTGVKVKGSTGYRWSQTKPNEPPAKPQRLVVASDPQLNPGTGDYAVTIRFRTTHSAGNIIQKGQAGASGGYWKMQNVRGEITCLFRGRSPSGDVQSKAVNSGTKPLNDGSWHKVVCARTAKQVTMTIDGSRVRRAVGPTGKISNDRPISIGGKSNCDQKKVTCDYFSGDIDYVRIDK
jgi:hypothetical protein